MRHVSEFLCLIFELPYRTQFLLRYNFLLLLSVLFSKLKPHTEKQNKNLKEIKEPFLLYSLSFASSVCHGSLTITLAHPQVFIIEHSYI